MHQQSSFLSRERDLGWGCPSSILPSSGTVPSPTTILSPPPKVAGLWINFFLSKDSQQKQL